MEQQLTRKDVKDTPFALIIDAESEETRIAMGNQIIVEKVFENEATARKYINGHLEMPWELIFNSLTMYVSFLFDEISKNNEKGGEKC